ncbi:cyclopropane-fatty-acyl-phospholipid synthase [Ophiostoma piceae UAMH 11346]|uniref:Cyclopropane-fatty-acyl-phospholipid synthase n=1 Tax=Ophiostoma piceae (strain UAMH 11346) TaxID=1262450 RepID=S3CW20_OPHP1|nr:cyclopropane-fatty-acyl-phospholipid synthase [Ophiostoma piceae UAMH 11346]
MSVPSVAFASSIPWPLAASTACALHAYSTLLGSRTDGLLLLSALGLQARRQLSSYIAIAFSKILSPEIPGSSLGVALAVVVSAALTYRVASGWVSSQKEEITYTTSRWTGPGKPLLLPCVTTHTRKFPEKHSFVYSYLVVGVPVGWSGVSGGMVSVSPPGACRNNRRKGWFDIDANDYLERGNGHLGLRGKLDTHLRDAHNVDPAAYPHAYLVTAARFLGYHFNPVSFWYLYDADKTLAAMILEVNNTFGERRMYFLSREESGSEAKDSPQLFKQKWPKDLHVSPFNSRKGSYELLANDPLAPSMQGTGPLSAKIVLRSSSDHSKIVACLASERRPADSTSPHAFDPEAMSLWQRIRFLAGWWWVGFATFPRIVRQAGILFFSKKLHVWFRPEPLEKSMGRLADETEQKLEVVFRQYLRHLVESSGGTGSSQSLAVKYVPCGIANGSAETFYSRPEAASLSGNNNGQCHVTRQKGPTEKIEFRVLTPVFYTRFVYYAHDVEALFCELRESCTVSISPPSAATVFTKQVLARARPPPPLEVSNPIDFYMFSAIQKLRRRPKQLESPVTWPKNVYASGTSQTSATPTSPFTVSDVRGFRPSAMDGYILSLAGDEDKDKAVVGLHKVYRSTVLKLFIADRMALGALSLLQLEILVLRILAAWVVAHIMLAWL